MLGTLNTRVMLEYLPEIWQGFLATLMLSAVGFAGALALGILACALSIQPLRWLRVPQQSMSTRSAQRHCWRNYIFCILDCRGLASYA